MRVALTMRVTEADGPRESRDCISRDWIRRLAEWRMTPLLVPNLGFATVSLVECMNPDILVLTGGDNLGATPERDVTERALLDHALGSGLPVLGVCRGLQLINDHLGGRLVHIQGHAGAAHPVAVAEAWRVFYGATATVNSYHDLGVPADGVAAGLTVTAIDGDGHIEGFHHRDKPLAAVMWHPERQGGLNGDRRLLAALTAGRRQEG